MEHKLSLLLLIYASRRLKMKRDSRKLRALTLGCSLIAFPSLVFNFSLQLSNFLYGIKRLFALKYKGNLMFFSSQL